MAALAVACAAVTAPAAGQTPDEVAQAAALAAQKLSEAEAALDRARRSRERVRALTETIRAFEEGLAALRASLRLADARERQLSGQMAGQEAETAALLGTLMGISAADSTGPLVHPAGTLKTLRAGLLMAEAAPELAARSDAMRQRLAELQAMRSVQEQGEARLRAGLAEVQNARAALATAIAERTDLPRRFTADPARLAILSASAETLDDLARNVAALAPAGSEGGAPSGEGKPDGPLPPPVRGQVLFRPGEADTAGAVRPGVTLATDPGALVTTPLTATLRYAGALPGHGLVAILEPEKDVLIVLAGLGQVFGEPGLILPAGSPVGMMPDAAAPDAAPGSQPRESSGAAPSQTLYIEVRRNQEPVDPFAWFAFDKD